MSRLDAIRPATRPKMHGRALISGPSGAGKTWTSLSMAQVLAEGDLTRVLMIDTERESALTYADVYEGFQHLPWRPPFDPTELSDTLARLGDTYAVVIIDSLSHFWRSQGGTLDIADGKIGGWKNARPVQERLVQSLLAVPAHVLLCVRSKMEYLIEGGRHDQTVTKLGMAPIQDDTLVYEVNIALDIDLEHRITVTKSRTPAVPVGRMYPAGLERKAAEDYAGWLAGGVPPASREDVDAIVEMFAEISDAEVRKSAKALFVEAFGMPHSLTADSVNEAKAWLTERLTALQGEQRSDVDEPPTQTTTPPDDADTVTSPKALAILATRAFKTAYDAAPKGQKTKVAERLRHALVHAATGGRHRSLAGLAPADASQVLDRLLDVSEGRMTYVTDDDGVVFTLDGQGISVFWHELDEDGGS